MDYYLLLEIGFHSKIIVLFPTPPLLFHNNRPLRGLIHISRLSMNFIEDPHQCVQVGDLLMTWVVNVDTKKNRVALTALSPAQRADAAAANEERRAQIEQERSAQRGGPRGGPPGRPGQARRTDSAPQRTGGSAGGRTGQPAGASHGGGGHGGGGHGSGGHGGGGHGGGQGGRSGRPERGGGGRDRDGSRGRGGRRGGDEGGRPAKSVVVTSKKPVAPISQAMKQGEEPLRSFSDLMQYYESNRSPKSSEPVVETQSNDNVQTSPVVADTNSDSNDNTNG